MNNEELARRLANVYSSIAKKISFDNEGGYLTRMDEQLADDALEIWRVANELHPQRPYDPRQLELF